MIHFKEQKASEEGSYLWVASYKGKVHLQILSDWTKTQLCTETNTEAHFKRIRNSSTRQLLYTWARLSGDRVTSDKGAQPPVSLDAEFIL